MKAWSHDKFLHISAHLHCMQGLWILFLLDFICLMCLSNSTLGNICIIALSAVLMQWLEFTATTFFMNPFSYVSCIFCYIYYFLFWNLHKCLLPVCNRGLSFMLICPMGCGTKNVHNPQLCEHVEVTSVSYITDRFSRWTQLQEHLHSIMQNQYNSLFKTFRFYWNCLWGIESTLWQF